MKICYKETNLRRASLQLIEKVNQIIDEYENMGYSLTLRQVYYQLVARDVIPNNERSYKNLGNLVNEGRMAGLISWEAIEDRTRYLRKNSHWDSPASIVQVCANQFAYDKWDGQDHYVEVWVEKDALVGVVGQICERLDVPYFSCRGYVSQTEMWTAARRLSRLERKDVTTVILHLGDHDPSGIDMSRDIEERLNTFEAFPIFHRIALNMEQIEEYSPPPNPTKLTDSRATSYIDLHGYECWELDALRPNVIESLISGYVEQYCDLDQFRVQQEREEEARQLLRNVSENWDQIEQNYG